MTTLEALDIVLDLAAQNVILDSELDQEAERQRDAIARVEAAVPEMLATLRTAALDLVDLTADPRISAVVTALRKVIS